MATSFWKASALLASAALTLLSQPATGQVTKTVLHNFEDRASGSNPATPVVRDASGNLYGTTSTGGSASEGVVYKVDPSGKQAVLHSFTGHSDGANPRAGLALDTAGNLYGTAGGGPHRKGVLYKVDASGNETILHDFHAVQGQNPSSGVIFDTAGNLYGTALYEGKFTSGTVYKFDTVGHLAVLYNFPEGGGSSSGGLILDTAGNLYGTTAAGGVAGLGTVFELNPAGNETVLYSFPGGPDGVVPASKVTLDAAGNIYGTTRYGGATNAGVLYSFPKGTNGLIPSVTLDPSGNLYGTIEFGGSKNGGVVYKLTGAAAPRQ